MTTHQSFFIKTVGVFLGLVFLVLACGSVGMMFFPTSTVRQTNSGGSVGTPSPVAPDSATSVATKGDIASPYISYPFPQPGQTSLSQNRDLIKTAFLTIIVDNLRTQTDKLSSKAKDLGGFASSSSVGTNTDGTEQATLSLRVPSTSIDALLQTIRSTALRVVDEQISSTDTTDQLVDIDARLKSLHQSDDQYGEILKQATNVNDILQITQARDSIRQQIEQLAAQKQNLESQVSFSTVTVTMSTETGLPGQPTWRPAQQARLAWQAFIRGLQGTVDTLIVGLLTLPLIALWLGLIWIGMRLGWKIIVWIRTRIFNQ